MNKYIFLDYIIKFFPKKDQQLEDNQTAQLSPDVEMLSPKKSYRKTPFPKKLTFKMDSENDSANLDFEEHDKAYYMNCEFDGPLDEFIEIKLSLEESEQPIVTTPKRRSSKKEIHDKVGSTKRRLNFDIPEDYELRLKSVVINESNEGVIEETTV